MSFVKYTGQKPRRKMHERLSRVERMVPGFKVIAGPYDITSKNARVQREQYDACAAAKQEQIKASVECKVLLLRDGAWVLRSEKGWVDDVQVRNLTLRAGTKGLSCPVCGRKPFLNRRGLSLHRCPMLQELHIGGRVYHQRLSREQIQQAQEAFARA